MVPVTITERAIEEIKSIMKTKKIPVEYGLRVGVKGAGCAGVSYLWKNARTRDVVFDERIRLPVTAVLRGVG